MSKNKQKKNLQKVTLNHTIIKSKYGNHPFIPFTCVWLPFHTLRARARARFPPMSTFIIIDHLV